MLSLVHGKLRLFNHVHLIPGTDLLLCPASTIGDFPYIYRIVNDTFHKAGGKTGNGAVLPQLLHKALPVQIFRHAADTIVGVNIAVKDGASYSYGSDETESLTIAVENSDDGAAIAVDGSSAAGGSKASLTLSGKNIAVTVPKGIFNGNTEGGIIPSNDTGTAYAGGMVQIGSARFPESFAPLE